VFSKYFQAELAYLREMGREFGHTHPAMAGLLSERGGDPDAERLLEGVAFLTARIRERRDAAIPDFVHALADLLMPHYLRPLPACSVVEFIPNVRAMRGALLVPRGTQVASAPIEGTTCTFRTTADLTLLPLSLLDAAVEYPSSTGPVLRVALQTSEAGTAELKRSGKLRFFLHGELPLSSMLLLWLARHCRGVEVRDPAARTAAVTLPKDSLRTTAFDPEEALLPWPKLAPQAYRLIQELFTLPEKFLFFELSGLETAPISKDRLEILFSFERPPPLPAKVERDTLRLHCVPVVNLFASAGEPVRVSTPEEEHMLRAADLNPHHAEVYSVDSVTSTGPERGDRREYSSFVAYAHSPGQAYYRLRRVLSPIDGALDCYISLGTPLDVAPDWQEQTLSTELTCTHRGLPAQLGVGDLCVATASSPSLTRFTNPVAIARPVRPPLGSEAHWRLLSHLALNRISLAGPTQLQALLSLYNFQVDADVPKARANALRIGAIRGLQATRERSFVHGAPVFGQRSLVELEESGFAGAGDLFLFGNVLDHLFASNLTLNSFHALSIRTFPSRMELEWTPRSGTQPLL
jgi:type VI secretion system protein ImpG